jgi:hypothetical protein
MRALLALSAAAIAVVLSATPSCVVSGLGRAPSDDAQAAPRAQPPSAWVPFENITARAGIDFTHVNGASPDKYLAETMGSGGLFLDFDADGWTDIFLVDGGSLADPKVHATARHRLYRNKGDGRFDDVSAAAGIRHAEYGMGACAADYDRDGRIDLYVTNLGPNTLYRNMGNGTFTDVTRTAGVGAALWSTSCGFADFDLDGDVDLFVTNYLDAGRENNPFCGDPRRRIRVYCHPLNHKPQPNLLYRNDGNGRFTDVSVEAGIGGVRGNGLGVSIGDYDDDRWPDVFVANDAVPNFLFHNDGKGRFTEVGLAAGVAVARDGKARAGMGTEFADYDGDGRLDLVVTNHEFETHSLFHNEGKGLFSDATIASGIGPPTLPHVGFGVAFLDGDNDGALDLAITNGHVVDNTALFRDGSTHAQRKLLFRNTGRRFVEVGRQAGEFAAETVGRTLAVGDVDNDGDLDVLVTGNGRPTELLRNDAPGGNSLQVRLAGVGSNRDGIGARLRLVAGGRTQIREVKSGSSYLGQNDLRAHFGLGAASVVDRLEVRWPGGQVDVVPGIRANQIVTVREGTGLAGQVPFARRASP